MWRPRRADRLIPQRDDPRGSVRLAKALVRDLEARIDHADDDVLALDRLEARYAFVQRLGADFGNALVDLGRQPARRLDANDALERREIQHAVERNPARRDVQVPDRVVHVAGRLETTPQQGMEIAGEDDRRADWIDSGTMDARTVQRQDQTRIELVDDARFVFGHRPSSERRATARAEHSTVSVLRGCNTHDGERGLTGP